LDGKKGGDHHEKQPETMNQAAEAQTDNSKNFMVAADGFTSTVVGREATHSDWFIISLVIAPVDIVLDR
jgi:hypothetical protein